MQEMLFCFHVHLWQTCEEVAGQAEMEEKMV